jgi:predicted GIY-YIG superfamily endonuclease
MVTQCEEVTYVLQCQDGIYYVGRTTQLHNRLTNHFTGNGCVVTKTYPPIKVAGIYAGNVEKEKVLYGRNKYGTDKCFGHAFHLNSK